MRPVLFLEVGETTALGILAVIRRGAVKITGHFSQALPEGLARADAHTYEQTLGPILSEKASGVSQAVVILPRKLFFAREISLPAGKPREHRRMAVFEMSKHLTLPVDSLQFAMIPMQDESMRRFLALATPGAQLENLRGALEIQGIRTRAVYPSVVGMAEIGSLDHDVKGCVFDSTCELAAFRGGTLDSSATLPEAIMGSPQFAIQVRRLAREAPIVSLELAATPKTVADVGNLGLSVTSMDLGQGIPIEFAALVGSVKAYAKGTISPLAKVLPPIKARPFLVKTWVKRASLVGAALAVIWCGLSLYAAHLESLYRDLKKEIGEKTSQSDEVKRLKKSVSLAQSWTTGRFKPVEWYAKLVEALLPHDAYISEVTSKSAGEIAVKGYTRTQTQAAQLAGRLSSFPIFAKASLVGLSPEDPRRGEYGVEFTIVLRFAGDYRS